MFKLLMNSRHITLLLLLILTILAPAAFASGSDDTIKVAPFMTQMDSFSQLEETAGISGVMDRIKFRASQAPFLVVATLIFICAIIHTFFAVPLTKLSHKVQHDHDAEVRREKESLGESAYATDMVSFKATLLHFLGEIEAIFGIWVLVLIGATLYFYNVEAVESYMSHVNFTEPMFVVVIMALASTRPVLNFAEDCLRFFAQFGKQSPSAWWLSILIVAPILGSFITEPGAMTIAAMLLAKKFYRLKPSPRFAYATLGLLFVNISVGGVLTNFAAPPVLMVAKKWELTTPEMFIHFGGKAILGILLSTTIYFLFFRKELRQMTDQLVDHDNDGKGDLQDQHRPIPFWVTAVHLLFMAWTVFFAHYPELFIGGFLFFLAFRQGTAHYQHAVNLRGPILVGFFLSGLVIHGGLQGWWLAPIISSLNEIPLFFGSTILTSFNDNAAITFLASQVDGLDAGSKYAVLAGAVTGGGLTVIANAPNPAGQALLSRFFGDGVSPAKLAAAALIPTAVVALFMLLMPDKGIEEMFGKEAAAAERAKPAATAPAIPDNSH